MCVFKYEHYPFFTVLEQFDSDHFLKVERGKLISVLFDFRGVKPYKFTSQYRDMAGTRIRE